MVGGAALIWILVIGAVFYATRVAPERRHGERTGELAAAVGRPRRADRGAGRPAHLGPRPDGRFARAGRRPRDRRLGRAVVVAGRLPPAGARRAGRQRQRGAPAQGPAGRDRAFQPGRDPRLLDPLDRRQGRHDPRPRQPPGPRADPHRQLPRRLRRVLRRVACADGLLGRGHGAGRVRAVAGAPGGRCRRAGDAPGGAKAGRCSIRSAAAPAMRCAAPPPQARSAPTSPISPIAPRSPPASCRTTATPWCAGSAMPRPSSPARACPRSARCRPRHVEAIAAYLEGLE